MVVGRKLLRETPVIKYLPELRGMRLAFKLEGLQQVPRIVTVVGAPRIIEVGDDGG